MTAHWLDIIPAMPLARGVPAIKINGSRKIEFRGVVMGPSGAGWRVRCSRALPPDRDGGEAREGDLFLRGIDGLRVDLADPQGFAYALRCLVARPNGPDLFDGDEGLTDAGALMVRAALGDATDADRLTLARALAEIAR